MAQDSNEVATILAGADRHRGRRLVWAAVVLAVAAGGWWLWQRQQAAEARVTWVTEPAALGSLQVRVTATGAVQPTTQVDISSELSGVVAAVLADFNDTVAIGQELVRLDTTKLEAQVATAEAQFAAAEARVAQADASLTEAEQTLAAELEMDLRGITTHRELVAAEAAHDRAAAARDIALADLLLASSNLDLARTDLAKATIRSPIDGVVLGRRVEVGQIVGGTAAASVLFTLAEDLRRMELQVDVDEADIGRLAPGQPATFTVDAFPGTDFAATVTQVRFAPETTEGVVTYKAVLAVDNTEGVLRPGMTATATITVAALDGVLTVPNAALRFVPPQSPTEEDGSGGAGLLGMMMPDMPDAGGDADGRSVWILRDGAPLRVAVVPGDSDGLRTAIAGGDLAPGDAVITARLGAD